MTVETITAAPGATPQAPSTNPFAEFAKFEAQAAKDGLIAALEPTGHASAINDPNIAPRKPEAAAEPVDDGDVVHDPKDEKPEAAATPPVTDKPVEKTPEEVAAAAAKGPSKITRRDRIGQLTREKHEAHREIESKDQRLTAAEQELADWRAGRRTAAAASTETPKTPQKQAPAQEHPGRPDASKFEFGEIDPDYEDAMIDWRVESKLAQKQAEAQQQSAAQAEQVRAAEVQTKWGSTVEAGGAAHDDFAEKVLTPNGKWALSRDLYEMSCESAVGHEVLYHLANNPDESKRIYALTPAKQGVEFAKLEARFSEPQSRTTPEKGGVKDKTEGNVTPFRGPRAEAPIEQARGSGGRSSTFNAATTDFAAFEKGINAQGGK